MTPVVPLHLKLRLQRASLVWLGYEVAWLDRAIVVSSKSSSFSCDLDGLQRWRLFHPAVHDGNLFKLCCAEID